RARSSARSALDDCLVVPPAGPPVAPNASRFPRPRRVCAWHHARPASACKECQFAGGLPARFCHFEPVFFGLFHDTVGKPAVFWGTLPTVSRKVNLARSLLLAGMRLQAILIARTIGSPKGFQEQET